MILESRKEHDLLRAMILALQAPRNRFGTIAYTREHSDPVHDIADGLGLLKRLPHGGYDTADKVAMLLQAMIGDTPKSLLDGKSR